MKEELKQKMIVVIGNPDRLWSQLIAEKCAQVAVDFIEARHQALSMSGFSVCSRCQMNPKPKGQEYCIECRYSPK